MSKYPRAYAVRVEKYASKRQALSGYHIGYEKRVVWAVRMEMRPGDHLRFTSTKTYASEKSAKAAAKRAIDAIEREWRLTGSR